MLVTNDFVFLHIPKTGGSFVQTVLRGHLPVVDHQALLRATGARVWTHAPLTGLPSEWQRLPVVCVVRNPWDWYVSWVSYQLDRAPRRKRPMDGSWEAAFHRGEIDFKGIVSQLCEGADLYSSFIKDIVGPALDRPDLTALRFETLRPDLRRFLRERGMTRDLRRAIRRAPQKKASDHGPYPDYYDAELRELVGTRTRWLCERFGYEFEHG